MVPSTRIRLSEFKDHGFQALVASFNQSSCFRMSRGIESGTTTHSLEEFLRQTTGKVGATIRTNDSWNGESCENLQQSFTDSFRIQRSKRISHRPTRKFVQQNQSIIVLGFRLVRFSSHYHRANTIHI